MIRLSTLLLGLVLLTGSACKKRNQVPESASIVLSKTACFGTCPIYQMTINGNGLATFEGERFTDKIGSFSKQLTEQETKDLFRQLATYDWNSFQDSYPAQVTDLPSVIFHFNFKDVKKKVSVRGEHPPTLDVINNMLSNIAESDGWTSSNSK